MPARYPVCLDVADRLCIVVGGGDVAERKVAALIEAGARIVVVSPQLTPGLGQWRDAGRLEHRPRAYRDGDLARAFLAIAATDDRATNQAVAAEARRRRALVNVADDPDRCDFTLPAVVRRGELRVAISTGGRSPAFARQVRDELERHLTADHAALLELAAEVRRELRARGQSVPAAAWQSALDEAAALARRGDLEPARARLIARLAGDTPARAGRTE